MAVLDRNKSHNNLLSDIPLILKKEYEGYVDSLENSYSENCENAFLEEKTADIAVIADKAQEFAQKHEFYCLYNAIVDSVNKINTLRNSPQYQNYRVPDRVARVLIASIKVHENNLKVILNSCQDLLGIDSYNSNSSKKELKKWAEALENLGDAFEDNIEFFTINFLENLRNLLFKIIETSQKKEPDSQTRKNIKNSYRIRIRNAAGFMCRMIDFAIEEAEAEDREILATITSANHPVFFEDRSEIGS